MPRTITHFMWGFQQHFRIEQQSAAAAVFNRLDDRAFQRWEAILEDMQAACDRHDYHGIAEADLAFHRMIFDEAELPDLLVIWETGGTVSEAGS